MGRDRSSFLWCVNSSIEYLFHYILAVMTTGGQHERPMILFFALQRFFVKSLVAGAFR